MAGERKLISDFSPCYQSLGDSLEERSNRYLDYINTETPSRECAFIQDAVHRGQLTGNGRYIEEVEKIHWSSD